MIAAANREVEEVVHTASSEKRGPYGQYSLTVRADIGLDNRDVTVSIIYDIGKYACHHSVTAPVAAPRFRDKRGSHECTILLHVFSTC